LEPIKKTYKGDYNNQRRRPNRRRRRKLSGRALAVFLLPIAAAAIIIASISSNSDSDPELEQNGLHYTVQPWQESEYSQDNEFSTNVSPANSTQLASVPLNEITDTGYLALINRRYGLQYMPYSGLIVGAWPTVHVSRIDGMYLHESALRAVSEMFATARQEEIAAFFVSSGFRSYDAQMELYGDGSNSAFVQPPGHSEHHTGLAADILAPGIGMMEMAYTREGQWLAANSYRYGLILRYPEHATEITGIAFEPWHFRYVGRVHAYFMKRNNLVLEEYIAKIHNYGHISFEKSGQTYQIMHQVPENGMIYVPYELEFLLSADNKGGFILLAW